jgi:hypothetical protein
LDNGYWLFIIALSDWLLALGLRMIAPITNPSGMDN